MVKSMWIDAFDEHLSKIERKNTIYKGRDFYERIRRAEYDERGKTCRGGERCENTLRDGEKAKKSEGIVEDCVGYVNRGGSRAPEACEAARR